MTQFLELGPVPADEECEQLGEKYDQNRACLEVTTYAKQLKKLFSGQKIGIKSFRHDFGSYYEAVVYYNDEIESEIDKAFNVENNVPHYWSDESKESLEIK